MTVCAGKDVREVGWGKKATGMDVTGSTVLKVIGTSAAFFRLKKYSGVKIASGLRGCQGTGGDAGGQGSVTRSALSISIIERRFRRISTFGAWADRVEAIIELSNALCWGMMSSDSMDSKNDGVEMYESSLVRGESAIAEEELGKQE